MSCNTNIFTSSFWSYCHFQNDKKFFDFCATVFCNFLLQMSVSFWLPFHFVFAKRAIPGLFIIFSTFVSRFYLHKILPMTGFQNVDLWYLKWPVCQVCHNPPFHIFLNGAMPILTMSTLVLILHIRLQNLSYRPTNYAQILTVTFQILFFVKY